jgi:hypothetical protein
VWECRVGVSSSVLLCVVRLRNAQVQSVIGSVPWKAQDNMGHQNKASSYSLVKMDLWSKLTQLHYVSTFQSTNNKALHILTKRFTDAKVYDQSITDLWVEAAAPYIGQLTGGNGIELAVKV